MFLNLNDPAKGALIRAAASTQTLAGLFVVSDYRLGYSTFMMLVLILLAIFNLEYIAPPQNASPEPKCSQTAAVQNPLLREAIDNRYTLRRIEFTGNETIRDYVLRRRVFLREGDFFSQRNLAKSLVALNKLKMLYPLTMNDVIVQLDKPEELIDVTFCFRERHSTQRRQLTIRWTRAAVAPLATCSVRRRVL